METKIAPQRKEVMSVEELAEYLGVGRTYAFGLVRDEVIPSFKIGRLRKVRLEDARAYVDRMAAG